MCIVMFTEAVLTETTISKQHKCPLMNAWISVVSTYNGRISLSLKTQGHSVLCYHMDISCGHYAK